MIDPNFLWVYNLLSVITTGSISILTTGVVSHRTDMPIFARGLLLIAVWFVLLMFATSAFLFYFEIFTAFRYATGV